MSDYELTRIINAAWDREISTGPCPPHGQTAGGAGIPNLPASAADLVSHNEASQDARQQGADGDGIVHGATDILEAQHDHA